MSSQEDALAALSASQLLDVLKWGAPAAFSMTNQVYNENAGHDQGVVGYLNFKHLKDLLDRATSNGRFALGADVSGTGADLLNLGIGKDALLAMPRVPGDSVKRSDFRQSPGWAIDDYRVLLQSYKFGGVDNIVWARRSEAKRQVASQNFTSQATLFDDADFGAEFLPGVPELDRFDRVTLVAAHAFDPITQNFELYVGQSRNPEHGNDDCWHWRSLLLSGGGPNGATGNTTSPILPGDAASAAVDDVPVRIRDRQAIHRQDPANG